VFLGVFGVLGVFYIIFVHFWVFLRAQINLANILNKLGLSWAKLSSGWD